MKFIVLILTLSFSFCAYSQNKIDALANYCRSVRAAYIDNNIDALENTISGYYPSTNSTKAEFFYDGTALDLSVWDEDIQIKGNIPLDSNTNYRFFDPSSVDSYIATVKGDVVLNEIPLLRAAPYDFLYTNFAIDRNSKVVVKASSIGETQLLITSDSFEEVAVSVKCHSSKYNEKIILGSSNPLEIFSWDSENEANFVVIIENNGNKPISIFLAKD